MNPNTKQAGLDILNHAYEVCRREGVPRDQIADLLTELRDAVLVVQHGKPILPDIGKLHGNRGGGPLQPHIVEMILYMNDMGHSVGQIAYFTGCGYETVQKYVTSLRSPRSVPASE